MIPHPPLLPALGCASCRQTSNQTGKLLNRVKKSKKESENGRDGGRGTHNLPQYIAALQTLKCVT